MAKLVPIRREQEKRPFEFRAEGSLSEIVCQLKTGFLSNLKEQDLDRPVSLQFSGSSHPTGGRLTHRAKGVLDEVLWSFKRGFLDLLSLEQFRRCGLLAIHEEDEAIKASPAWVRTGDGFDPAFFGLREPPFAQSPNPRFFYASPAHAQAASRLVYAINQRKGFALITGEVGSGKTTVCRTALKSLDPRSKVALIMSTFINRQELLIALCEEFDIEPSRRRKINYIRAIQKYLIECYREGVPVVLIVDEAQNLAPPVLEEIRMLSNLETEEDKLIQIVLMGQPELAERIDKADLEQLRQRIMVRYHLFPLEVAETQRYIEHRLQVAGPGSVGFDLSAFQRVFEFSRGIPRLINSVCDAALVVAYNEGSKSIGDEVIEKAILDLQGESPAEPQHLGQPGKPGLKGRGYAEFMK